MDEQVIRRAAEAAVNDLRLDCGIEKVSRHPRSNEKWCVQFTGDYGQFCDEFHNKSGQENSPEVIREKIKNYFLKMRKPVRVRRGSSHQTERGAQGGLFAAAPLEIVGQAIDQTIRLVGEVVNQVSGLARSALDTEAVVSVELPIAAPTPPPPPRKSRKKQPPAKKKAARKSASKKAAGKVSSRAGKATPKAGKAAKVGRRKSRATVGRTTSGKKGR